MVTVIVQHEVNNFADWKIIFDADEPMRTQAGLKSIGLFTSVKNPNDVTFIFEAPAIEIIDGMMNDASFQEKLRDAGVIGVPSVSVLTKA